MVVRVSQGLKVAEQYGNFTNKRGVELDLPTVDCDKVAMALLNGCLIPCLILFARTLPHFFISPLCFSAFAVNVVFHTSTLFHTSISTFLAQSFGVRLEHEGKLEDKSQAALQVALLYTTTDGYRRIRVHTLSLTVTSVMANIFRHSDLDAIVNLSLKQAVRQLHVATTPVEAQQALTAACVESLFV